eukprot:12607.XXX_576979_584867_1 [CDS] Oithona nana genome sequencing.
MINWRTRERQWELEELDREKQLEIERERASCYAKEQKEKARREKEKALKEIEASLLYNTVVQPSSTTPSTVTISASSTATGSMLTTASSNSSMDHSKDKHHHYQQQHRSNNRNSRDRSRHHQNQHHHGHHRGGGDSDLLSPIPDVPSADERSDHDTPKHHRNAVTAKDLHTTASYKPENQPRSHHGQQRQQQKGLVNASSSNRLGQNGGSGTAQLGDPEQSEGERITGMLDNFAKALGDIRDIREKRMKSEFSCMSTKKSLCFLFCLYSYILTTTSYVSFYSWC